MRHDRDGMGVAKGAFLGGQAFVIDLIRNHSKIFHVSIKDLAYCYYLRTIYLDISYKISTGTLLEISLDISSRNLFLH